MSDIREQLLNYIGKVFDNENLFIKQFLPKGAEHVAACYMASGATFIRFQDGMLNEFEIVIDTDDFIDWCDSL